MMRLGTQTGSMTNHLLSRVKSEAPAVGMGVTFLCWTDRHAGTIRTVATPATRIWVQEDKAIRTDSNGHSDQQEYRFEANPGAPVQCFTLRKNGAWVKQGEAMKNGQRILIGQRDAYHDYSF